MYSIKKALQSWGRKLFPPGQKLVEAKEVKAVFQGSQMFVPREPWGWVIYASAPADGQASMVIRAKVMDEKARHGGKRVVELDRIEYVRQRGSHAVVEKVKEMALATRNCIYVINPMGLGINVAMDLEDECLNVVRANVGQAPFAKPARDLFATVRTQGAFEAALAIKDLRLRINCLHGDAVLHEASKARMERSGEKMHATGFEFLPHWSAVSTLFSELTQYVPHNQCDSQNHQSKEHAHA